MIQKWIGIISLIALAHFQWGCGGCEVGNPGVCTDSNTAAGDAAEAATTSAESIRTALCTKLVECYSSTVTSAACVSGISPTSTIDTELGLASGYGTYSEIVTAEGNGSITANSTRANQCLTDINALSCSDTSVQNAYSTSDASNYSNVFNMIPTGTDSCAGVYAD